MSDCQSDCPEPRAELYDKRRFVCFECGIRFKDKWMLKRHVNSKVCLSNKKVRGSNKKHKEDVGMSPLGVTTAPAPLAPLTGEQLEEYDLRLPPHFKIYLVGPSRSGKTTFCLKLLRNLSAISKVKIEKVFWVYSTWQDEGYAPLQQEGLVDEWFEAGQIRQEMNERMEEYVSEKVPLLIIFDDCMHVDKKTLEFISKLFTLYARHKGVSIVFIRQKFFGGNEFVREIDRNADVCVITSNPREGGTVCKTLARQMGSIKSETLTKICEDATAQNPETQFTGYLWINLNQPKFVYLTQVLEHQGHFMMAYQMDKQSEGFRKMILLSKLKYNELLNNSTNNNNNNNTNSVKEPEPSTSLPPLPGPPPLPAPPPPPPPPVVDDQIEEADVASTTVPVNTTIAATVQSGEKRQRDEDDDDDDNDDEMPKAKRVVTEENKPVNNNNNNLKKSKKRKFDENKNDENEKQPRKSIRLRNKKAPQPCQLCGFTTDNPKTMIEHVETAHPS